MDGQRCRSRDEVDDPMIAPSLDFSLVRYAVWVWEWMTPELGPKYVVSYEQSFSSCTCTLGVHV